MVNVLVAVVGGSNGANGNGHAGQASGPAERPARALADPGKRTQKREKVLVAAGQRVINPEEVIPLNNDEIRDF